VIRMSCDVPMSENSQYYLQSLENKDKTLQKDYDLPPDEIILRVYKVRVASFVKISDFITWLYVTDHYLCCKSKTHGKIKLEISKIKEPQMYKGYIKLNSKVNFTHLDFKSFIDTETSSLFYFIRAIWERENDKEILSHTRSERPKIQTGSSDISVLSIVNPLNYSTLTEEDWKLILKGARTIIVSPDNPIAEGSDSRYLYRIVSGSVVLKTPTRELFTLKEGDIFGEITFLTGPSGTVYEAFPKEVTKLSVIEPYYFGPLFQHYPSIAGKFYAWIASILCDRLNILQVGYI